MKYDALVYLALFSVVVVVIFGGWVILNTKDDVDFETRKLRFAAATFTGITMLFVFISVLYFASDKDGHGQQIFDKGFTAMFTLAGTILGYLFGATRTSSAAPLRRAEPALSGAAMGEAKADTAVAERDE
jgi:cytochrome bd-type quinol oxidase subunit 2